MASIKVKVKKKASKKRPTSRDADALMNASRVAEVLGIAYQTVANAIDNGSLPSIKYEGAGGRILRLVKVRSVRGWRVKMAARWGGSGTVAGVTRAKELRDRPL